MMDNIPSTPSSALTMTETTPTTAGSLREQHVGQERDADSVDRTLLRRPWRRRPLPWQVIRNHPYKGSGTEQDPYVVTWLGDHDTENPQRYSTKYKWAITIIVAMGMLSVTMGSSILSGAIISIRTAFPGHHAMVYNLVTGIYILGFVFGPFGWAPLSEVFGRRFTFLVSLPPYVAFDAAVCGSQNIQTLLLLRFFAGMFGCSPMTNAGGIISDMFNAEERGLAMGVFGAAPWLGPTIGPIIGGFLSEKAKWKWVAAVAAIFAAILAVLHMVYLPETYTPVLLRNRASALSEATGKVYRSPAQVAKPFDGWEVMKTQLKVPYILLFCEPIVFILNLYVSCVFGILYMQFTSFPIVYQQVRGWSPGIAALAFIGLSVGCNLALVYIVLVVNKKYSKNFKEKGHLPPEARLPPAVIGGVLVPIGLIVFAWTCVPASIHWSVSVIATVPYGAGMVLVFLACLNYLVDAYLPLAASVMSGGTVMRSLVGVILPLFTVELYNGLGIRWGATLVAGISLVFVPVPILLLAFGRRIRRMTKRGRESDDHLMAMAGRLARPLETESLKRDDEQMIGGQEKDQPVSLERANTPRTMEAVAAKLYDGEPDRGRQ